VTVVETVLEAVDDFFIGDIDYSAHLSKKQYMYLQSVSPCSCLTIARFM
jgi:hypothetical protein